MAVAVEATQRTARSTATKRCGIYIRVSTEKFVEAEHGQRELFS